MEVGGELDLTAQREIAQVKMEGKNILESKNRYFLNSQCR